MAPASPRPSPTTVMDRPVLARLRMAGAVVLAAILVTACDTWPFASADPTLTWESNYAEALNYPLGQVDVEREGGSVHLEGQFELPECIHPGGRLVNAERSVVIHVDTERYDGFCTQGGGSMWWDFSASISGLDEGRHVVRIIVERPSRSDTIYADTVSMP